MPFDTMIIVTLITGAFLTFAVGLAYGQIVTSNLDQDSNSANSTRVRERDLRKAA